MANQARTRRLLFTVCGLAGITMIMALPSGAALETVAGLFAAGQYDAAGEALAAAEPSARPGEMVLWQSRLATDPAAALTLLSSAMNDNDAPTAVRQRATLEAADIEAGRGNHAAVLKLLEPLLADDAGDIAGAAYLRAGLSLRASGQLQQAREMLASVRPNDPDFVLARYYLGDIGLDQKDVSLARRYFNAAEEAASAGQKPRLAAGLWKVLRAAGDTTSADAIASELQVKDPGSLALLEIRRLIQLAADESSARAKSAPLETPATPTAKPSGRYALQIGAFSDRALALEFVKRYREELPELRIDKIRDQRGQFLYKVRLGDYVNPALARSDARKLAEQLKIEVISTETTPAGGTGQSQ